MHYSIFSDIHAWEYITIEKLSYENYLHAWHLTINYVANDEGTKLRYWKYHIASYSYRITGYLHEVQIFTNGPTSENLCWAVFDRGFSLVAGCVECKECGSN